MDPIELKITEGDEIVIQNKDLQWLLTAAESAFKGGLDRSMYTSGGNPRLIQALEQSLQRVKEAKARLQSF
jgi:hypothetical protein